MYSSVKELFDCKIKAEDGEMGHVHDVLFDENAWCVRYIVVDTGPWLIGRKVLVAPVAARGPDETKGLLPVALTKRQVKDSPDLAVDPPLSRDQEIAYHDYYNWPYYWANDPTTAGGMLLGAPAEVLVTTDPEAFADGPEPDPHSLPPEDRDIYLRSAREVVGYRLERDDQTHAEIFDLVLETPAWTLPFVVVQLGEPEDDRRVLLPSQLVTDLAWPEKVARAELPSEALWNAPAYDESALRDPVYFDSVAGHYSRRV